jgi:NADP-dependent aldehyde dehydrogenase
MSGQLTCSYFGTEKDENDFSTLIDFLPLKAGRIISNGVPTGVEVCDSMHHGGPFPASSDSRFTAVGKDAIYRFLRPVSFQRHKS